MDHRMLAPARHLHAVVDAAPAAVAPAAPAGVPVGTAPRGFALYVGLDELKAAADGVSLSTIVTALRQTLAELAPHAESYATVALAPAAAGGRDVDVVRLALHEPSAVARTKAETPDARAVTLVASGANGARHDAALRLAGYDVTSVDADVAVRAGLFAAGARLYLEGQTA